MSFLDAPLDFTRREIIELRDLFLQVYWQPDAAKQIASQAGMGIGDWPLHPPNMRLMWSDLLRIMANRGQLRAMVEIASEDPAGASFKHRFAEMLTENPPVKVPEPPHPIGWWKGNDQNPIIARKLYYERLMDKRRRMLHVDVARQLGEMARSVAKLEIRFAGGLLGHGTGFLIQSDLILTNYHNLFDPKLGPVQSVTADFDDERGIPFNHHLVVNGKVETIQGAVEHDWAVFNLEQAVDRPPLALGSPTDVGLDDTLIIIQHPLGGQKMFALDAKAVRYQDDQIVQYIADTQKGSSGAPVFNSTMQIVALHHAEAEVTLDVDGKEEIVWRNEGIQIRNVMQALAGAQISFAKINV